MSKRAWVLAVVFTIVGVAGWRWRHATTHDDGGVTVTNRVWIERLPSSDRDPIETLLMIDDADNDLAVGAFQKSSAWRGAFEVFLFERDGDTLELTFPQTDEHEHVRARARRCNERGMDYCLEVTGSSRGIARYVSKKGWEIGEHDLPSAQAHARALLGAATHD